MIEHRDYDSALNREVDPDWRWMDQSVHLQAGIWDAVHELRVETMRSSGRFESVPDHVPLRRPGVEAAEVVEPVTVTASDVRAKLAAARDAASRRS